MPQADTIDLVSDIILRDATLSHIAVIVRRNWKNVNFGAVPYLDALQSMTTINENFGADPGTQIVAYFLSNATTWRGDVARLVKAELNKRLKAASRKP